MLGVFVTFLLAMFVPLFGVVGLAGVWFLRIAIPIMCLRWWIRYGGTWTADLDMARAKRTAIFASVAAGAIQLISVYVH